MYSSLENIGIKGLSCPEIICILVKQLSKMFLGKQGTKRVMVTVKKETMDLMACSRPHALKPNQLMMEWKGDSLPERKYFSYWSLCIILRKNDFYDKFVTRDYGEHSDENLFHLR